MKTNASLPFRAVLLLGLSLLAVPAVAQYQYTTGHADLGIGYEDGEFNPHWHIEDTYEYAPDEAVAVVSATLSSPAGAAAALGVADGSTIWVCGKAAYQPNLGFGAEELVPSDWVGGSITLTLTAWSGPGNVAIFSTNMSNTAVVDTIFSTYNAAATLDGNTLEMFAGDHLHYTFAFTEVGAYSLEFTWSGTHVTDGVQTKSGTFGFNAVPEPSTNALFIVAGMSLLLMRLRRVWRLA